MMRQLSELVGEDIRLRLLCILSAAPAYTANEVTVRQLLEGLGHSLSRDALRTHLAWLEEQDCLIAQQPGGIWLATLTSRGEDVARGVAHVPGVARPRPE